MAARGRVGGCSDVDGNGMLVIQSGGGREEGRLSRFATCFPRRRIHCDLILNHARRLSCISFEKFGQRSLKNLQWVGPRHQHACCPFSCPCSLMAVVMIFLMFISGSAFPFCRPQQRADDADQSCPQPVVTRFHHWRLSEDQNIDHYINSRHNYYLKLISVMKSKI